MRRVLLTSAVLVCGTMVACSDQHSPLPTQPPVAPSVVVPSPCPQPPALVQLIVALFPPGDLVGLALQRHASVNQRMARGDVAGARQVVLAFIDFTLKTYYQGKLRNPTGIQPPITQRDAVIKLIDGLLCWVGLPPSGLTLAAPNPTETPVTTKVIGPAGGDLIATDGLSAIQVAPGTVSADRLWVITRRDDLAPQQCVTTTLEQVPPCIDFSVVPAQDLAKPLLVVICQANSHEGLRLAHQVADGKVELLTVQGDPFGLSCPHTASPAPPGLGRIGRAVWRFSSFLVRVIGPTPAYATHTGLGGLLGPKLSNVTAVRVKLGFVQQPTNVAPGGTITPAVTVAFQDATTGAVATQVTNRILVRLGTNPGEGALAGTATQAPTGGVAAFPELSINNVGVAYTLVADALGSGFTSDSLLHMTATSAAFNVLGAVGVCPTGGVNGLVTFTNFPDAIAAVASAGKVEVCSGTFTVNNVQVAKPVTIEAAREAVTRPVIQYSAGDVSFPDANGFLIDGVESGTVAFRRLAFVSSGTRPFMISAQGTYDQVIVDSSDFTVTDSPSGTGVFGGSSTVEGSRVVVNHSSLSGGESGVFASGDADEAGNPIIATAPHFDVLNSTLHDFTFSGIQYQSGASGRISGNTVSACGFAGCIRSRSDNQIEISGNAVTVDAGRITSNSHIRWGVAADVVVGGSQLIVGNTIIGVGGGGDPSDPASYAIQFAGIGLGRIKVDPTNPLPQLGNAMLSGNTIVNADTGISAHDAVITGTDNVITQTLTGIAGVSVAAPTSVSLNRSDVTSYLVPMDGGGLSNLTCNWWGDAAGPHGVPEGVPASVFTPFAAAPIANNAAVTCGGSAPGAPRINGSLSAPIIAPSAGVPRTKASGVRTDRRPPLL